MSHVHRFAVLVIAIGLFATTSSISQIMFNGAPGTAAPPATLGPFTMIPFSPDPGPLLTSVTTAPGPNGNVTFSQTMSHYRIGSGWSTWSHGYTGDVYGNSGTQSITMSMPANTVAFYFYAEPNAYNIFTVQATAQDGSTSGPINVNGYYGATYFGFFSTNGVALTNISVTVGTGSSGFAVGEFGIFQCAPPTIAVTLTPSMLWPPNHKMKDIVATVTTTGSCGGNVVTLESVTSNEPDNGPDDGNTINDIQGVMTGTADYAFSVRAERSGIGFGRMYTATYKVVDGIGFTAYGTATVEVPLNMSKDGVAEVPGIVELDQNYPNPFNPLTTISYGIPSDGLVKLVVYDLMGREVATLVDGQLSAGTYRTTFDGTSLASGQYVYRLTVNGESTYRTMTLAR